MIPRCKMGGKAKDLLNLIVADAFGNAGLEQEHPEEAGLWCDMTTGAWATALGCKKQYVTQLVNDIESYGILTRYQASEEFKNFTAQRLRLTPDFTKWLPLQEAYALSRYTRVGAGRPPKSAGERKSFDSSQAGVNLLISDSQPSPLGEWDEALELLEARAVALAIRRNSKHLRLVDKKYSKDLPQGIKGFTPASDEAAPQQSAAAPLRITKEKITKEEENTYMVASATQASIFPEVEQELAKAKMPPPSKPKHATKKLSKTEALLERRPELRPLHEMAIRLFGKPMGLPALDWANYLEELGDRPVTANQLEAASRWYRQRYRGMSHSLKAVTGHYPEYEQEQAQKGATNHAIPQGTSGGIDLRVFIKNGNRQRRTEGQDQAPLGSGPANV